MYAPPRELRKPTLICHPKVSRSRESRADDSEPQGSEPIVVVVAEPRPTDAPAFPVRDGHDPAPGRRRSPIAVFQADRCQAAADCRDLAASPGTGRAEGQSPAATTGNVMVGHRAHQLPRARDSRGRRDCAPQIRSLKSEVAALQRELSPLRERVAKAELLERAKQKADQEAQEKSAANKKPGPTLEPSKPRSI